MRRTGNETKPARALRCAIYTRVSTESGLEQDFNSLDNQREASEAYIKSQAHEGWKLVRERYDDGGFSGASMDRPALQRLLAEVRSRRIDVIVVYKVDRLTRSLADFAKLVELFEANGVSFISVTQAFNTTTSMGRLTLNMLLSFAQFEREITGERIRDKVAASKRKGIWMGGAVPLGYRVENRALHVVVRDAEFVRALFRRYLELGSVVRLKSALDAEGITSPVRVNGKGKTTGGGRLSRGHLYWILSNPIYVGLLRHKGRVHDGLHSAIVDAEVWDTVQAKLASQTQKRRDSTRDELSFLAGKLFDDRGHRMGASFAAKGSCRYRYYVSRATLTGRKHEAGAIAWVSAPRIEALITEAVEEYLAGRRGSPIPKCNLIVSDDSGVNGPATIDPRQGHLPNAAVANEIERITLTPNAVEIVMADSTDNEERDRKIVVPWTPGSFRRRREIIQPSGDAAPIPKRAMKARAREVIIDALADAQRWLDQLLSDPNTAITSLAACERKSERSIRMKLSLAFLSPDLKTAAIEGRLPRGFNMTRLSDPPLLWVDQWDALGLRRPVTNGGHSRTA
jgi:site-specific DNA recombinase